MNKKFKMNLKLKVLMVGIIMSILISGCVEKPPQNDKSVNTSTSTPFFPVQKEPATIYMTALLSDKPEELELVSGCLRVNNGYDNYLLVWPYGFSLNTEGDVIQVIDDTGQSVVRVGDKIKVGGGADETPDGRVARGYSAQLPSDRCSGPYWIVAEVITVDKSTSPVAAPTLKSVPSQYFPGQAFDEAAGILTKKWDAENFAGFWRDSDTGASTEVLIINQSTLNNSYRIIEKHNLKYSTKSIPVKYQVYAQANKTPPGTEGFYQAIGWLGEKYTLLQERRLAKIIYEQNASDVKIIRTGDSWDFGEEYRLFAQGITAPLEREAWIKFLKGNNVLDEKVLPDRYLYSYPADLKTLNDSTPVFVTYISSIYKSPVGSDKAELKYTWLRSHNIENFDKPTKRYNT